jgi:hypothetical protein
LYRLCTVLRIGMSGRLLSVVTPSSGRQGRVCAPRLHAGLVQWKSSRAGTSWVDPIVRPRGDWRPRRRVLRRQAGVRVDALIAEGGAASEASRIVQLPMRKASPRSGTETQGNPPEPVNSLRDPRFPNAVVGWRLAPRRKRLCRGRRLSPPRLRRPVSHHTRWRSTRPSRAHSNSLDRVRRGMLVPSVDGCVAEVM